MQPLRVQGGTVVLEADGQPILVAGEHAAELKGIEDAFENLDGNDHIAASLLISLAARLWQDAGAEPETFVSLCQTLIRLEAEARRP